MPLTATAWCQPCTLAAWYSQCLGQPYAPGCPQDIQCHSSWLHTGCRLVKESEEQGDLPDQSEAPQLWNGQPFHLAPSAPLPDCSKGCARAQPLVKWVRQTHGTGGRAGSFGRW